jgi:hypothetical protein
MGATNAHPAFVAMVGKFEEKWNALFERTTQKHKQVSWTWLQQRLEQQFQKIAETKNTDTIRTTAAALEIVRARALTQTNTEDITSKPGSAVIVDDIILFAKSALLLFVYFICILDVLEHHRVTLKLKKARFLPTRAEFVGIDVLKEGNSPASSK